MQDKHKKEKKEAMQDKQKKEKKEAIFIATLA